MSSPGPSRRRTEPIGMLRPVPGAPAIPLYALARGPAPYEGQPVVSVAATSRHIAEDAVELIDIDYEPLPHVSDVAAPLGAERAPSSIREVLESNLLVEQPAGQPAIPRRRLAGRRRRGRGPLHDQPGHRLCRWRRARSSPSGARGAGS